MSWIIPFDKAKPTPEARRFNRWMYRHPWRFFWEARLFVIEEAMIQRWNLPLERWMARFHRRART